MAVDAIVAGDGYRSSRLSTRRATVVVASYLVIVSAGTLLPLADFTPEARPQRFITPGHQVALFLQYMLWLVPLIVAMERDPYGRFWKLVFAYVASAQVYALAFTGIPLLWTVAVLLENFAIGVLLHLLLAFPSGRLRGGFDRAVIGAVYAYIVVVAGFDFAARADPLGLLAGASPATGLFPILRALPWLVPVLAVLVEIAVLRHWHDASPAARRGLLPIVIALPLVLIAVTVSVLARGQGIEPVIDFFDRGGGLVAVGFIAPIAFTLGVVRLRFRRGRIADLVVELGSGVPIGGLEELLARTLDDPTMELAFPAPSGDGFVNAEGRPIGLPGPAYPRAVTRLERDGELLGLIVHDPAIDAEDPGLVEAVGNAARLALENERLAAQVRAQLEEVRASRARLVDSADAERRRLERDLHDGAQQRLVALALRLQLAKETNGAASGLLDDATAELETAIGEVRDLARGLHPTLLTEAGLAAAIEALAERAPLPVDVEVPDRRYEAQVEATAYFVIAEALTNVARHAHATVARVAVVDDHDRLTISVADDGVGAAEPGAGTGLRGLADRVAAAGGRLTVSSPPGGGTMVEAELPSIAPDASTSVADRAIEAARSEMPGVAGRRTSEGSSVADREPRVGSPGPVTLFVAVVATLVVVVVAALSIAPPEQATPAAHRDDTFALPFDYLLPPDTNVALAARSARLHVLQRSGGDRPEGISIWIVGEVLVDPCRPDGPMLAVAPGVDGLVRHMRGVAGLGLTDPVTITVDGRPATRLDATVVTGHTACAFPDIGLEGVSLWRDDTSPTRDWILVPRDGRVPLTILEMGGETVVLEIWSYRDVAAWLPVATGIVESIRFHNAGGASAPSRALPSR
ncbi:MAG TPA: histidine kinase [Candidatus Limnocylindrales bacterium]